jgi:hypothetical protein
MLSDAYKGLLHELTRSFPKLSLGIGRFSLANRLSIACATPLVHFTLVILEMVSHELFARACLESRHLHAQCSPVSTSEFFLHAFEVPPLVPNWVSRVHTYMFAAFLDFLCKTPERTDATT